MIKQTLRPLEAAILLDSERRSWPMEADIATPAQRSDPAPLKDQLEVLTQRLAKIEKESEQDQASESSWARASQEA